MVDPLSKTNVKQTVVDTIIDSYEGVLLSNLNYLLIWCISSFTAALLLYVLLKKPCEHCAAQRRKTKEIQK